LRIISGSLKSRRINPPSGLPTRPTTDRAKEGLFNILQHRIDFESITFLDLFAGTGNITFEVASRGCKQVTCVDNNSKCVDFIRQTAKAFHLEGIHTFRTNVFSFLSQKQNSWDIIFADPPYDLENLESLPDLVFTNQLLRPEGLLIIEHSPKITFRQHPRIRDHRIYGLVNFSLFA